jgi:hypothetical protein
LRAAVFVAGLLLVTTTSCLGQSNTNPAAALSVVTIPFDLVNKHVMLKVRVNNSRPLSFILDTGAKFAIIDRDRAKELGLNLQGEVTIHGGGAGSFVKDSSFTIPGLPGFSQPVTLALPLGNLASGLGQDLDGIIGTEFISQFVVELDYQARVVKLHDKNKFNYAGSGESVPIRLNSAGHPIMEAEVTPVGSDSVKGKFVLDIGSGVALALYTPFVAEHHLPGPQVQTIKALGAAGADGEITGRIGRISELKIGKFRISSPITLFSESKTGLFASADLLGNIGEQIACRFRIFLDYNQDRVIFEPNSSFAAPFDRAFSGLSMYAEGKDYRTFRIDALLENSPGSEAGLHRNDIIIAIDGKPAAELTLTKLIDLFERPTTCKLDVQRGTQMLKMTLTPRRLV